MSLIKMFCYMPRKAGITSQEFHDHWRHPHGTLGMKLETLCNFVQGHQIHSPLLGPDQSRYEGLVEVWFDNAADAADLAVHPLYQNVLVPDGTNFIDMENIGYIFTEEEILVSGPNFRDQLSEADLAWRESEHPTTIKLIQFIERDGSKPWDSDSDIELGRSIGAFRHVRCRPNAALHPDGADYIGIRELWWPTLTAFSKGVTASPDAWREMTSRPAAALSVLVQAERFV